MTIGLDASTTVCGWAFSENGTLHDAGFLDISKISTNKDKSYKIVETLEGNSNISLVKFINLESPLFGFIGGFTTQQTIIKLVRFNAVLEYILSETFKIPVNLVNVSVMRKKVIGKARIKGMKSKDFVKQYLPTVVPNIEKFHKLNKRGVVDKKCEDMYDAIVASLF